MAKLKLDNGTTVKLKFEKNKDHDSVRVLAHDSDGDPWYVATFETDGTVHIESHLILSDIPLQYDDDGAIKLS